MASPGEKLKTFCSSAGTMEKSGCSPLTAGGGQQSADVGGDVGRCSPAAPAAGFEKVNHCTFDLRLRPPKLAALTSAEEQEAPLFAAQAASDVEPSARAWAADKLQEMLESKQANKPPYRATWLETVRSTTSCCRPARRSCMTWGVPLYDFPFRPSEQTLGGRDSLGPASKERTRPCGVHSPPGST
ncbi:uncharacterized protein LOC120825357 [Gasterosteus aculeatus]